MDVVKPPLDAEIVLPPNAVARQGEQLSAKLRDAAGKITADDIGDHTKRSYGKTWALWEQFIKAMLEHPDFVDYPGLSTLTVDEHLLVLFVEWMITKGKLAYQAGTLTAPYSPATLRTRLYGITGILRQHLGPLAVPKGMAEKANKHIGKCQRQAVDPLYTGELDVGGGRGEAPALLMTTLRKACELLPDDLVGHRDRAMLLIHYGAARRRAEVALLTIDDVTVLPAEQLHDGKQLPRRLRVHFLRTKGGKEHVATIYEGEVDATCPVRAWDIWAMERAHFLGSCGEQGLRLAFFRIDRHGNFGGPFHRDGHAINTIVKARMAATGDTTDYTGHSLRRGPATQAAINGASDRAIRSLTGHSVNSTAFDRYIRDVQHSTESVSEKLGF